MLVIGIKVVVLGIQNAVVGLRAALWIPNVTKPAITQQPPVLTPFRAKTLTSVTTAAMVAGQAAG